LSAGREEATESRAERQQRGKECEGKEARLSGRWRLRPDAGKGKIGATPEKANDDRLAAKVNGMNAITNESQDPNLCKRCKESRLDPFRGKCA
jgi:hypothetical protein